MNKNTNTICKYLFGLIITCGLFKIFLLGVVSFNQTCFTSETLVTVKEAKTNLSHVMFVIVGSSGAWKHRSKYIESWWRPNKTRGNLFLDVEPSKEEFFPWSSTYPPFVVNEDIKKLSIYPKLRNPIHTRIYRSILETYRLNQDHDVRWYVTGDDDTLFFVDNLVDVLSQYDHTKKHYIGMYSESIRANFRFSYEMAFGGGGYALSYPLVEALVTKLDQCIERYHYIWAGDELQSLCLADLGVDLTHNKGFHQLDLRGDVSGLLSAHPSVPVLGLHHFDVLPPFFPDMGQSESVSHLMKAANVDQSRILQQSICHLRSRNWTFSVSWGYSIHIYENIFPRSYLIRPIQTFNLWSRDKPPLFMFNTRFMSTNQCEAPHWFFFDSIDQENEGFIVTSYARKVPRNLTSCSLTGNNSADPVESIRVLSYRTPKKMREVECCDVEYKGANVAEIKLRDCWRDEIIA